MPGILEQGLFTGTLANWNEQSTAYSPSLYSLTLPIRLLSQEEPVLLTVEENGDLFSITFPDTIETPGDYYFQYVFTNKETGKKYIPYSGEVYVGPVLTTQGVDPRTRYDKILEELYDCELRLAKRDYVEINVNGKVSKFKSLKSIQNAIAYYEKKAGKRKQKRILTRFSS